MAIAKTRLRIYSMGGVRVSEVRELLRLLEEAYNAIAYFEASVNAIQRASREFAPLRFWPLMVPEFVVRGRLRGVPPTWPPGAADIASHIRNRDRLVLAATRLKSPGFWEFFGKLNPLEVIRQYLSDRHERRKDREYREAAERRRLELENKLLENRVLKELIDLARQVGVSDDDLSPLLNELVLRPLDQLGRQQDSRLIETAELSDGSDDGKDGE